MGSVGRLNCYITHVIQLQMKRFRVENAPGLRYRVLAGTQTASVLPQPPFLLQMAFLNAAISFAHWR